MLLTRSPLSSGRSHLRARLACVKHAASVHSEPGSNSPLKSVSAAVDRNPRPIEERVVNLLSRKQETLLLLEKQEKDVWHALLSFQGTGSRFARGRAVPPAQPLDNVFQRPKFQYTGLPGLIHEIFVGSCAGKWRHERRKSDFGKSRNPEGPRTIGVRKCAVKLFGNVD